MIPMMIQAHLRLRHQGCEHLTHDAVMTAQDLAAVEHVSGRHVAKPVVVKLDGHLAIAVVAATERVNLAALEEALGVRAELVPEPEFEQAFRPCEAGAEPPLALFGIPIFVDQKLETEKTLLMAAGSHEDAVLLDTHEWLACEKPQPIANLGVRVH